MRISRRDLLRRMAAGTAVTAAIGSPLERALLHAARATLREAGTPRFLMRLDRNHNPYGPSNRVIAAMTDAVNAANIDSEEDVEALRARIADEHGVTPQQVVVGNGSGSILRRAIDTFAERGRPIVTAAPTFELIADHARRAAREVIEIPLCADGCHDLDAMLARGTAQKAGLIYICNPNNPTGTLTRWRDLEVFLTKLPASVHVVIDEAYHHYVDDGADYRSFIGSGAFSARVIVTRSFSKIHGLAGLRIGYAIAQSETAMRIARPPALAAPNLIAARAAIAALDDGDYVRASRMRNTDDRQDFFNQANARMLRWIDSQANFVMLSTNGAHESTNRSPEAVIEHFAGNRIALPHPIPPLNQYIRVSLGTPTQMQEFWRVWDLMPHTHQM
jgi:histidinol-phosphate aminotransferase